MANNIFVTERDKQCGSTTMDKRMIEKYKMEIGVGGVVLNCTLERIENGYLVRVTPGNTANVAIFKTYYAPDLKAAGEQITALAVTYDLTDDPRRGGDG